MMAKGDGSISTTDVFNGLVTTAIGALGAGVIVLGVNTGIIDLSSPPPAAAPAPAAVVISPQAQKAKADAAEVAKKEAAAKKAAEKAADDAAYKARCEQAPSTHPPKMLSSINIAHQRPSSMHNTFLNLAVPRRR